MAFPNAFATARLRAERLRAEHQPEIHRMHQDAAQMALLGGVRDAAQTAAYMERNLAHWDTFGFGLWLLRDAATDIVVGRALLRHFHYADINDIEVGYSLYPQYWGQGLAVEATTACLHHATTSLSAASVIALTRPENRRSQRVLEKVGMVLDRELLHDNIPHVLFRTPAANGATPVEVAPQRSQTS